MTSQNLATSSPNLRLHLVNSVAPGNDDGVSLSELSVAEIPEGAMAFVVGNNAFYRYKPRSTATDAGTGYHNVVKASGAGNWVRSVQVARTTLTAGSATVNNAFDLSGTGDFIVSGVTSAGTPGFRTAVKTSLTQVTVTSTQGADTSQLLVQYIETAPA